MTCQVVSDLPDLKRCCIEQYRIIELELTKVDNCINMKIKLINTTGCQ